MLVTKDKELLYMTPIKTAMMILIVLYHSCAIWMPGGWFQPPSTECVYLGLFAKWLNTFHVPVFVFASGYLYGFLKFETSRYEKSLDVLKKKSLRLLIPYFFIASTWVIPIAIALGSNVDIVKEYLLCGAPSQLWFLVMLFMIFVLFESLTTFFKQDLVQKKRLFAVFFAILYFIGFALGKILPFNIFQVRTTLEYSLIFYLGVVYRTTDNEAFYRINPSVFLVLSLGLFIAQLLSGSFDITAAKLISAMLLPLSRIAGVAMVVSFASFVLAKRNYERPQRGLTMLLEKHSMAVYLVHQQIIYLVISALNTPAIPPAALALCNFCIALSLSLLIAVVLSRFKATRFLLGEGQKR